MKHLEDIEVKKMRLRILQLEQERAIRLQWQDLKASLQPSTFIQNTFHELSDTEAGKDQPFAGILNHGVSYLSHRLAGIAGDKLEATLQEGINKLAAKK